MKNIYLIAFLILAKSAIVNAQNVGIGVPNPLEKLHVNGAIRSDSLTGTGYRYVFADPNGTLRDSIVPPASDDWKIIGNAGTNPAVNFLGTTDAQDLVFRTNNIPRFRTLASNGFVGIGVATPLEKLHVNGAIRSDSLTGTGYRYVFADPNGTLKDSIVPPASDDWKIIGNAGTNPAVNFLGTTDAQDLVFRTNNIPRIQTLASNGFVGIGTATPIYKLHVSQGSIKITNNTWCSVMPTTYATGNFYSSALCLRANGTEATPTYPIADDIFGVFAGRDAIDVNAGAEIQMRAAENISLTNKGSYMTFHTTSIGSTTFFERMRIDNAGNVGIGITNPTSKLQIVSNPANGNNPVLYATRDFNGQINTDAGFIGGIDAGFANTGVYFVQKDNSSLSSLNTNLINVVSNNQPQFLVNGQGNVRIGTHYFGNQCSSGTAIDEMEMKLAVMGGFSTFGSYNNDPVIMGPPGTSWVNGVGSLTLGMNRQAGTSNVDFWNVTDPINGAAALLPADRGYNWRNFQNSAGSCSANLLMTLNGIGDLTIAGANYLTSDKRLKTNVKPIENSILEKVLKLEPSRYTKNASGFDPKGNLTFELNEYSIEDFGFIAQDFYKIFPELVYKPKDESKELWAVDYARLSVMLTKALQEQNTIVKNQEQRISSLENKLNQLLNSK